MSPIRLSIKHGATTLDVSIGDPERTVASLQLEIEGITGVFQRHQKLIFKGERHHARHRIAFPFSEPDDLILCSDAVHPSHLHHSIAGKVLEPSLKLKEALGAAAAGGWVAGGIADTKEIAIDPSPTPPLSFPA